jgi:Ser/Thr protein kinase RdoA (MazF antagonist)
MMRAAAEVAAARVSLGRVVGSEEARRARLEPLAGGTHRRSWLVTFDDARRAVLRTPVERSNALLDLSTETRAMDAAAGAGLAPLVIAADAASGVLLTDYRPGTPWTSADLRLPSNLERLAAVLRTLHALPTELPTFAAERIAARYLAARPRDVGEPRAAEWGNELLELARRYDRRYAPTAFCHNDLVAANVLDDGELVLVDFEYAVRGEPLLDLANAAGMNGFDADERRALLTAYAQAAPTQAELEDLTWLVRMVRLMAWFWALLGEASVDDPLYAPYLAELGDHLRQE